eukprot:4041397-Amphidinium_carterae.2
MDPTSTHDLTVLASGVAILPTWRKGLRPGCTDAISELLAFTCKAFLEPILSGGGEVKEETVQEVEQLLKDASNEVWPNDEYFKEKLLQLHEARSKKLHIEYIQKLKEAVASVDLESESLEENVDLQKALDMCKGLHLEVEDKESQEKFLKVAARYCNLNNIIKHNNHIPAFLSYASGLLDMTDDNMGEKAKTTETMECFSAAVEANRAYVQFKDLGADVPTQLGKDGNFHISTELNVKVDIVEQLLTKYVSSLDDVASTAAQVWADGIKKELSNFVTKMMDYFVHEVNTCNSSLQHIVHVGGNGKTWLEAFDWKPSDDGDDEWTALVKHAAGTIFTIGGVDFEKKISSLAKVNLATTSQHDVHKDTSFLQGSPALH